MCHAHPSLSDQGENAATETRLLTTRSLPFSPPIWIFWLYRKRLTTEPRLDCCDSCIATSPMCWAMLGDMAGRAAAQGSNSWTVGWCWLAATQSWMHGMSATQTEEGRTRWQPRERFLPRWAVWLHAMPLVQKTSCICWVFPFRFNRLMFLSLSTKLVQRL